MLWLTPGQQRTTGLTLLADDPHDFKEEVVPSKILSSCFNLVFGLLDDQEFRHFDQQQQRK
jgi:hypothetical protein